MELATKITKELKTHRKRLGKEKRIAISVQNYESLPNGVDCLGRIAFIRVGYKKAGGGFGGHLAQLSFYRDHLSLWWKEEDVTLEYEYTSDLNPEKIIKKIVAQF